jgi:hypothetical protein
MRAIRTNNRILDLISNNMWLSVKIMKLLIMKFSPAPVTSKELLQIFQVKIKNVDQRISLP